jgi:integrase
MSTGYAFRRGRVWWIQYSVGGRRYRESAKTTRKENAEALLRKRQQEVWEGRFFAGSQRQKPLTLGDLRDLWLRDRAGKRSLDDDRQRLGAIVDYWGEHRLISTITTDEIRALRTELSARKISVATVNRYLGTLRAALNLATRSGHSHRNPMVGITLAAEDNARDRLCTVEEYHRLVSEAHGDLGACITVAYWCGMRLGEIVGLRWERVDLKAGILHLAAAATKEATAKTVPLAKDVVKVLSELPRRLDGKVFAHARDTYSRDFGRLVARLEIVNLHFHDLRHTALTNMADAGIDIVTMAAISGHKTLEMLKRYVHRRATALKDAMAKVEAHAAGLDRS